jgi:hypothetical protein
MMMFLKALGLYANLAVVTVSSVNCEPSIVLFVKVCVPVVVTTVEGKVLVAALESKVAPAGIVIVSANFIYFYFTHLVSVFSLKLLYIILFLI